MPHLRHTPHIYITENAEQDTFNTPCCCFENAPNTDLLLIRQSMRVLFWVESNTLSPFGEKYIQLKY